MTNKPTPASQQSPAPDDRPCQRQMLDAGLPAPRTCPTCKLGPCKFDQPSPARSDKEAERAKFEVWARRTHRRPGTTFDRAHNGTYKDNRIAAKWASWQACAESKAQESAPSSELIATWEERQRAAVAAGKFAGFHDTHMAAEIADLRAALARRATAGTTAARAGFKLVPLAYTAEMRAAWDRAPYSDDGDSDFACAYSAMIAAAPDLASASAHPHPDDEAVDYFASAMKAKMAQSRAKGRGGWEDPAQCPVARLQDMLLDHLGKGDPVDVANFCMMLWHRDAPVHGDKK